MTTPSIAPESTMPEPPTPEFELPTRLQVGAPLSERHPWLYPVAVRAHQTRRWLRWQVGAEKWAHERETEPLPVRIKLHKSLLLRQLGESEMWLQHNKVTNLRLACQQTNGLLIRPGESFSFNKVVGNCTRKRGFVEGMRLSNGKARPGVGGGICQLANLLHWMFLHSDLTIVERSEHSFDPFPDNGRVLPWGVGCSIVYNYVDLVVRNDTDATFQLLTTVGERYLEGELRCDQERPHSYRVHARNEEFLTKGGEFFRRNEIWRDVIDRRTGNRTGDQLVKRNCAQVMYLPEGVDIIQLDG
ncbi:MULTISPECIES: VanW family protein [unclassified Luteococcus]|uniref:VanW family protein n=1 Tax=unclassified Luteococcus TaxID=2639923 RepID=UPI00313EFBCE